MSLMAPARAVKFHIAPLRRQGRTRPALAATFNIIRHCPCETTANATTPAIIV